MAPFIYGLVDPRDQERIRYVGMSIRSDRPYDHIKATRKSKRKSHLYSWIKVLLADGYEPVVLIIEQCDDNTSRKALGEREKYHIKRLRDEGYELTNMTEGGEGGPIFKGQKHTSETRALMREAWKTRTQHAQTPETRIKIGNANRGRRRSPEAIERMRRSHVGHVAWNKGKRLVERPIRTTPKRSYRKVTPELVIEIRASWPQETLRAIAKRLNISAGSVYCIVKRQRWKDV